MYSQQRPYLARQSLPQAQPYTYNSHHTALQLVGSNTSKRGAWKDQLLRDKPAASVRRSASIDLTGETFERIWDPIGGGWKRIKQGYQATDMGAEISRQESSAANGYANSRSSVEPSTNGSAAHASISRGMIQPPRTGSIGHTSSLRGIARKLDNLQQSDVTNFTSPSYPGKTSLESGSASFTSAPTTQDNPETPDYGGSILSAAPSSALRFPNIDGSDQRSTINSIGQQPDTSGATRVSNSKKRARPESGNATGDVHTKRIRSDDRQSHHGSGVASTPTPDFSGTAAREHSATSSRNDTPRTTAAPSGADDSPEPLSALQQAIATSTSLYRSLDPLPSELVANPDASDDGNDYQMGMDDSTTSSTAIGDNAATALQILTGVAPVVPAMHGIATAVFSASSRTPVQRPQSPGPTSPRASAPRSQDLQLFLEDDDDDEDALFVADASGLAPPATDAAAPKRHIQAVPQVPNPSGSLVADLIAARAAGTSVLASTASDDDSDKITNTTDSIPTSAPTVFQSGYRKSSSKVADRASGFRTSPSSTSNQNAAAQNKTSPKRDRTAILHRELVGKAVKHGFTFEKPAVERPDNVMKQTARHREPRYDDEDDGIGPISLHRRAAAASNPPGEHVADVRLDLHDDDPTTSSSHADSTTTSQIDPEQVVDVIRVAAENGLNARQIKSKLSKKWTCYATKSYTSKRIQQLARIRCGINIELRSNQPGTRKGTGFGTDSAVTTALPAAAPEAATRPLVSRPTTSGKAPLPAWKARHRSILFSAPEEDNNLGSEHEDSPNDSAVALSDDEKRDKHGERRPVYIYKVIITEVGVAPNADNEQVYDVEDSNEYILSEHIDQSDAHDAAAAAIRNRADTQGCMSWEHNMADGGLVKYTLHTATKDICARVMRQVHPAFRDEELASAARASAQLGTCVYEIREEISLVARAWSPASSRTLTAGLSDDDEMGLDQGDTAHEPGHAFPPASPPTVSDNPSSNDQIQQEMRIKRNPDESLFTPEPDRTLLTRSRPISADLYRDMLQANAAAAHYTLEKVILPSLPRSKNLDANSIAIARARQDMRERIMVLEQTGAPFSEETVVRMIRPEGGEAKIWKVWLQERRIKGPLN